MGSLQRTPEPIGDTIPVARINPDGEQVEVTCLRGTWSHIPSSRVRVKEALVGLEVFPAGKTARWVFWRDQVHYILDGKAEMTYSLAQTRFTVQKKVTVRKGDAYVIPAGADIKWEVDASGPLKHLCVTMPAMESYLPGSMIRPDGSKLG